MTQPAASTASCLQFFPRFNVYGFVIFLHSIGSIMLRTTVLRSLIFTRVFLKFISIEIPFSFKEHF